MKNRIKDIMAQAQEGLSGGFYKDLVKLATIVVAVIIINNHMTKTSNDVVAPIVAKLAEHEKRLSELEPKVLLTGYRLDQQEVQIKEFLKPESPRIRKR